MLLFFRSMPFKIYINSVKMRFGFLAKKKSASALSAAAVAARWAFPTDH